MQMQENYSLLKTIKMLNVQESMFNECVNVQCIKNNALNYCFIANSLLIEYCPLNIVSKGDLWIF